ncbi:MAG: hypothetical protein Q9M19_07180 [Mariprofundaceae bacterium]|nr:hypothetical protein [Mariprofundaceae bacterium]
MKIGQRWGWAWMLGLSLLLTQVAHAAVDVRMQVELGQSAVGLDMQAVNALALPTLWQKVVPLVDLRKAQSLQPSTALVLQFSPFKNGVKMVYNPSQVRRFLQQHGIAMIPYQPHWNLTVQALAFPAANVHLEARLMEDSAYLAETMGFRLSPRGRKLALMFTPSHDVYGKNMLHVGVQGAFTADLLSQTAIFLAEDVSLTEQLQAWLHDILGEIRDVYSLGAMQFTETNAETTLTIEGEHSLSTQVMLEQALLAHPAVVTLIPTLLQQNRRQYRLLLRDGATSWLQPWFAEYGLTANQQVADSFTDWLVQ